MFNDPPLDLDDPMGHSVAFAVVVLVVVVVVAAAAAAVVVEVGLRIEALHMVGVSVQAEEDLAVAVEEDILVQEVGRRQAVGLRIEPA